jgi:sporulation protein YlmC with PRC-barrel domain
MKLSRAYAKIEDGEGARMRALIRVLAAVVALAMSAGSALAAMGKTTTDVALRRAPTAQAELILNLSEGTLVNVGRCLHGWCGVTWNKYGGYVRQSALQFLSTPASGPPAIPVFPPYPYKAGHYPTADAYYDLPPYAAIDPSFYRWRHFLLAQERNRYRYMPHIFRGYTGYREDTVGSYVSSTELVSKPISPSSPPKTEPSPAAAAPSPQAPEVSPPPAAPAPSPQAPQVSPPSAAPEASPQAPEVSPPPAAPAASPQAPEVSPPPAAPGPSPQPPEVSLPPSAPGPSPQPPEGPLGVTANELRDVTKGWSAKRSILGQPIYSEKDERVGSVDDLVVTRDKAVAYAIVNAGGFLGLMKHNVAIPVSQFKFVDNKFVLPGATKEALKASPQLREVTNGWSVKRSILGQPVYNDKNERVGSVDDIVVTPDKAVSYAIINAGGFLRLTKHNVAIPVSQLKLVDNKIVLPGATNETLKAMPEFQFAQ